MPRRAHDRQKEDQLGRKPEDIPAPWHDLLPESQGRSHEPVADSSSAFEARFSASQVASREGARPWPGQCLFAVASNRETS